MNDKYPRCIKCRQSTGILDRSVSTFRFVCGNSYDLLVVQLCKKCAEEVLIKLDEYIFK